LSVEYPNETIWQIGRYSYTMSEYEKLEKPLKSQYWGRKESEAIKKRKIPITLGLMISEKYCGETNFITNFKKITQSESQKVDFIKKVIEFLDKHEELNTTQIIKKTRLSSTSVIRTMKLLRDKEIVWMRTHNDKKNNEKIYKLRRWRAVSYMVNLLAWKNAPNFEKTLDRLKKEDTKVEKLLPENFGDNEIIVPDSLRKLYGEKTKIKNLFSSLERGIKQGYVTNIFCKLCLEKGYLSRLKLVEEIYEVCPKCGSEKPFEEEIRMTPRQYKRQRNLKRKVSKN